MQVAYNTIRKGLQQDVRFKGLKSKYIYYCLYLGVGTILFGLFLSSFLSMLWAIVMIAIVLLALFIIFLSYSRTYGSHGFVKKLADRNKPTTIKINTPFEHVLLWKNI